MLKLDPKDTKAYAGIGICLDKLGKKTEAQRYYRKFLINKPESPQASFVKTRMQKLRACKTNSKVLSLV